MKALNQLYNFVASLRYNMLDAWGAEVLELLLGWVGGSWICGEGALKGGLGIKKGATVSLHQLYLLHQPSVSSDFTWSNSA